MLVKLAPLAAMLLLAPGCPLLEVEATVPETCVTIHGIEIDGAAAGTTSLSESFVIDDLEGLDDLADLDGELSFVHATLTPTSGISDFTFVHSARVAIASGDPSSTLPTIDAYACDGDCVSSDGALRAPVTSERNALEYLATGSIAIDLAFEGELPTIAWTMDATICVSARVSYEVSP